MNKIEFNDIFVGLFDEGTVRRRVSIDRSGLDINEGKKKRNIEMKKLDSLCIILSHMYKRDKFS